MRVAFSPCPNDTFLFYAWVHGRVGRAKPETIHLADIQELNCLAQLGKADLIKVSTAVVGTVMNHYCVLPVGAALGFDCGPLIIARSPFSPNELIDKRIAIPGKETSAHLLLELFFPAVTRKHFCLYHEAPKLLAEGVVDAAVIIHEHRFTFAKQGFVPVADLGSLWHERYHLPLPLGCLLLRRTLESRAPELISTLRESLRHSHQNPDEVLPYLLSHAQELSPSAIWQHVACYVNEETRALSDVGMRAIECFLREGIRLGRIPSLSEEWLCRS